MKKVSLEQELKGNAYPGRGIVIGRSKDGTKAVAGYFIMGRSQNSRNRVFVEEGEGIRTQAFDPSKLEDPSLIIYAPVRVLGNDTIVTNGDQTDTVYEGLEQGKTFEVSLRSREFEPDAPNYTPRISGVMHVENGTYGYQMSILKSNNGDPSQCNRYTFSYDNCVAGEGHFIHTYMHDGNPLPSFEGEPKLVEIPDDIDEMIKPYVAQRLLFYLENTLYFDICIPICLATFGKEIKLDENVEIIRISEELQKARQIKCKYEIATEDWLAACATHMIVLHNYSYSKDEENSGISLFQDYLRYPLEKIDEIMGIVRLATGYEIGYEHIFCVPQDWIYETTADLAAVYGAKSHFVNHKYIKSNWINLPVSYVSEEQCDDIVALYDGYQKNEKRLKFSLMRYNRCVLREELDDITTDACIGLESLLAGGTHTEITIAIASRMPFVISKVENNQYLPTNGRKYMKKINNLRSRIVHGDKLKDKDIYIENNQTRIYIPKMAVDFLRIVLVFMIKNPIYLNVEEIDGYIDSLVSKP